MSAPAPSVRALAFDGDADFVVRRAEQPPTRADALFRADARPLAGRLAYLIARAGADPAGVAGELHEATVALGDLAASYDVAPVETICRTRAGAVAAGDPRALAVVARVAHGLLGEPAPNATPDVAPNTLPNGARDAAPDETAPTAADAVEAAPSATTSAAPDEAPHASSDFAPNVTHLAAAGDAAAGASPTPPPSDAPPSTEGAADAQEDEQRATFRPPTGPALVALLADGISGLERWPATPPDTAAAVPPPASQTQTATDGVVPISALCYSGASALARAREVRDALKAGGSPPDPALLDELYDLLDLVAL